MAEVQLFNPDGLPVSDPLAEAAAQILWRAGIDKDTVSAALFVYLYKLVGGQPAEISIEPSELLVLSGADELGGESAMRKALLPHEKLHQQGLVIREKPSRRQGLPYRLSILMDPRRPAQGLLPGMDALHPETVRARLLAVPCIEPPAATSDTAGVLFNTEGAPSPELFNTEGAPSPELFNAEGAPSPERKKLRPESAHLKCALGTEVRTSSAHLECAVSEGDLEKIVAQERQRLAADEEAAARPLARDFLWDVPIVPPLLAYLAPSLLSEDGKKESAGEGRSDEAGFDPPARPPAEKREHFEQLVEETERKLGFPPDLDRWLVISAALCVVDGPLSEAQLRECTQGAAIAAGEGKISKAKIGGYWYQSVLNQLGKLAPEVLARHGLWHEGRRLPRLHRYTHQRARLAALGIRWQKHWESPPRRPRPREPRASGDGP